MSEPTPNPNAERVVVNLRMALNAGAMQKFKRNGRDKISVPFSTMKGGQVLNGVRYSNRVIRDALYSFENAPVPYDHPTDQDGRFLAARSNEGLAVGYMGGHMENCAWVNEDDSGRVKGDIVFDVKKLRAEKHGRETMARLEKGDAIETSTGLYLDIASTKDDSDGAKFECLWMMCDHNAILPPGVEPAASTESGTGVYVNAKTGEGETLRVFMANMANPDIPELGSAGPNPEAAGNATNDAEGLLTAALKLIRGRSNGGNAATNSEADMANDNTNDGVSKNDFEALSKKVDDMAANAVTKDDLTALNGKIDTLVEAHTSANAAERKSLTDKIVATNALTQEQCDATPMEALRALAGNADETDGEAAPLGNSKGSDSGKDENPHDAKAIANRMNRKSTKEA